MISPLACERDRDREMRHAVQEVGGAVERIHDPGVVGIAARDGAALLHQEAEVRPRLLQLLADRALGFVVGGGDEVARPLGRDLELRDLAEVALQCPAPPCRRPWPSR